MMAISFFSFLVIVNRLITVTAGQACSPDQSEHDGSCYYFSPNKVNFDSSKSSCEALGMHLVYIGSQEEQSFLQNSLSGTNEKHWIGLSKLTWLDGSSLTYNNFAKDYTILNDGGTCFRINRNSYTFWYDSGCFATHFYICEKERGSSTACESSQREYDGSCYFFSLSESDFYSSKSSCEDLGMHLVYIGSQEEQDFLVDNRPDHDANSHYWIGLSSVTWLDGSSLTYVNFAYDSKTFDEGGSCFVINPSKSFKWLDDNCADNQTRRYICEKEGGIQTSPVQHTTTGTTTSTAGSTPNKLTSSGTSSSTTHTDNIATTSGSTQHSPTAGGVVGETTNNPTSTRPEATSTSTTVGSTSNQMTSSATSSSTTQTDIATTSGSTQHSTTTTGGVVSETTNNATSTRPTSEATLASTTGQGSTASEQATDTTPATMTKRATQTTTNSSPLEKEIQTSSVRHIKQKATTSPDGSTETTPDQGTPSKTSIPSTRTGNHEIQTSSVQHTKQKTTASPDDSTETTPNQGTPSKTAIPTARKAYKKFKMVADNTALVDAYVRSSHSVFSLIGCSQRCFADTHCSCFIYIECEGLCLLGGECPTMSTDAYERRPGAKLYSASYSFDLYRLIVLLEMHTVAAN